MGTLIHDVDIRPLKQIHDERGAVMHMLRADAPWFTDFGEVYFSIVKSGAVKAWKRHKEMIQNLAVPVGEVKFVIYDDRDSSPSKGIIQEIITGINCYQLIRIPPMVWYGFVGCSNHDSLITNCASMPHSLGEVERLEIDNSVIPYTWK